MCVTCELSRDDISVFFGVAPTTADPVDASLGFVDAGGASGAGIAVAWELEDEDFAMSLACWCCLVNSAPCRSSISVNFAEVAFAGILFEVLFVVSAIVGNTHCPMLNALAPLEEASCELSPVDAGLCVCELSRDA